MFSMSTLSATWLVRDTVYSRSRGQRNIYHIRQHDVSWGTKGSDKMEALPSLKVEKEAGGEVVVKDIQRVSISSRHCSMTLADDARYRRTKTSWTTHSSLSLVVAYSRCPKTSLGKSPRSTTRTRHSGKFSPRDSCPNVETDTFVN